MAAASVLAAGVLAAPAAARADVYLAATLVGANEVGEGDDNGKAVAYFHISGSKIEYAVRWQGVGAPTAFHIHQGKSGRNGPVKIPFFGQKLPTGLNAVAGISRAGADLLADIAKSPKKWYANLHTGEFPGGAVRAQLKRVPKIDLVTVLDTDAKTTFTALANATQEVREPGKKVGDQQGVAVWLVWVKGRKVHWATLWHGLTAQPANGHLHRGKKGVNGPVAVDFFAAPGGLPKGITGASGVASASSSVAEGIKKNPKNWYTNLHTADFPDGAVRGQLSKGGW
ncbi:CHRD domain-containing protein [Streptosporangium sp. G11]|uniref:CHRD domain-containing protein n=1 Tax=Streptosporangium sp. G11 TaxID=3436926 RepID=UPI003EBAD8F5